MTRITIGLINNMPDSALEATETQFSRLLAEAGTDFSVEVRPSSLPGVPRGEAAAAYIDANYWPLERILAAPPDAIIVTGTEPLAPDLRSEPYWGALTGLLDWSLTHTESSLWSCLAAHAAVLHLSGIQRQRLPQKCCGVFEHEVQAHALTREIGNPLLRTPHSRWNDLPAARLRDSGYEILSHGELTGANIFLRRTAGHLAVFLQGHPEYDRDSLLKEYKRDVGRWVRFQQERYPTLPHDYFTPKALALLEDFQRRAFSDRRPQVMATFPVEDLQTELRDNWHAATVRLYRNWLHYIAAQTH